ncbi:MAG: hypothetical protein LBB76_03180 [Azoarcus sp.]|nr:hypothetical protein [Azoarcus sp.]
MIKNTFWAVLYAHIFAIGVITAKNIFLVVLYVQTFVIGMIAWHLNDKSLSLLFLTMVLSCLAASIFLKKYLFILMLLVVYIEIFSHSWSSYTFYVVSDGVVEKQIPYDGGTIFIVRFPDNSVTSIVYGKDKQCFGGGNEGKYRCRIVLTMLDNFIKTGRWGQSNDLDRDNDGRTTGLQ